MALPQRDQWWLQKRLEHSCINHALLPGMSMKNDFLIEINENANVFFLAHANRSGYGSLSPEKRLILIDFTATDSTA